MSLFGDFGPSYLGMPSGGGMIIAVDDFGDGSSDGLPSTDYTNPVIADLTPKAVLILHSNHLTTNDPSATPSAKIGFGAITALDQVAASTVSRDGTATTDNKNVGSSQYVYQSIGASGGLFPVTTAAGTLIPGGINLLYGSNQSGDVRVIWAAFCGSEVTAKAGTISLGTGTSAIDVNDVGFRPDAVIFFGDCHQMDDSDSFGMAYTFGMATADGTQRCVLGSEAVSQAADAPFQVIYTDAAGGQVSGGALTYKLVASGFDSLGFSVTPSASTSNDVIGYLALKFNGHAVKIKDFSTPIVTGHNSITGVGFQPQFALAVLTALEATDSLSGGVTTANQGGLNISLIGDEQWSAAMRIESGAPTTSSASLTSSDALIGPSHTTFDLMRASLVSFDGDGLTLNYSAVQATVKKGFMLCVQ